LQTGRQHPYGGELLSDAVMNLPPDAYRFHCADFDHFPFRGIVSLIYVNRFREQGLSFSVFGPWAQIIAGLVILICPELTLWLVAVLLGGGLILSGVSGLTPLRDSEPVNTPCFPRSDYGQALYSDQC
jgi:hypothetical protein